MDFFELTLFRVASDRSAHTMSNAFVQREITVSSLVIPHTTTFSECLVLQKIDESLHSRVSTVPSTR